MTNDKMNKIKKYLFKGNPASYSFFATSMDVAEELINPGIMTINGVVIDLYTGATKLLRMM